jgi:nitrite reductase/ring-hydroxylating ferredoxin subunit
MKAGRLAFLTGAMRALVRPGPPPTAAAAEEQADPRSYDATPHPRAELAVAVLLVLGGLLCLAFAVLVAAHPDTQLLGTTLAGGLGCIGAALALASKRVVPQEVHVEELGAPVVVVRVEPASLELPPERRAWAPQGILAFSQICTHAGCAITLFRYPVSEETSKPPGLVCPCHYSTFDVRRAAKPVFGPAVRPLPQLPLAVDRDGFLVADGPLAGSVGPSWLNVRQTGDR